MAWVAPITWVTGTLVTAAMMNQDVRDNVDFVHTALYISSQATPARAIDGTIYHNGGKIRLVSVTVTCNVTKGATAVAGWSMVRAYCDANAAPVLEVGAFGVNISFDGLATQGTVIAYGCLSFVVPSSYYYKISTSINGDGVLPTLGEWTEWDLH